MLAKLVEIVNYDHSTVQCCCIRSISHDQVQISRLFRLNRLGAQCTYERGSVAIIINCTHPQIVYTCMLVHLEINSTCGRIQENTVDAESKGSKQFRDPKARGCSFLSTVRGA